MPPVGHRPTTRSRSGLATYRHPSTPAVATLGIVHKSRLDWARWFVVAGHWPRVRAIYLPTHNASSGRVSGPGLGSKNRAVVPTTIWWRPIWHARDQCSKPCEAQGDPYHYEESV
jgi:hypothetical protein